jgi:nucleoside-diphosphate-sugar epimerase
MNIFEKLNNKTVVVTGASGYIGSELVNQLSKYCSNIICVSRKNLSYLTEIKTIIGDISDFDMWMKIILEADIIFHLAGNTSIYDAAKNPDESLRSTVLPINQLIKAAGILNLKPKVIFASTVTLYGLTSSNPVNENLIPNPVTIYDQHKLFAEQQLILANEHNLVEAISLRLANVYGPSSSVNLAKDRGILNKITVAALNGQNLKIYGDGNYLRDYIYIADTINAFLYSAVYSELNGQAFNIGSGIGTTIKEAFECVAKKSINISGKLIKVTHEDWPIEASAIESRNFIADIERFSTITGWKPLISFNEGLDKLIFELVKLN